MTNKEWVVEEHQYLTFTLDGEIFGINILQVREIIEYGGVTKIPMMPDYIKGVINLRGNAVPVIDLSLRLGRKKSKITPKTCIVITEIQSEEGKLDTGMMVDGVDEVLELPPDKIEPPPNFGAAVRTDFIHAMGKIDDKFVVLLDSNSILTIEELDVLEEAGIRGEEIISPE